MLANSWRQRLRQARQDNLHRFRRVADRRQGIAIACDGKPCINFCSNDYLGLSQHPAIIEALQQGVQQYGVGSSASQLVCGHYDIHQQVEAAFAKFLQREAAVLFTSGYAANVGVISALLRRQDVIFADKLNHASLVEACRLSPASVLRYTHSDIDHLRLRLENSKGALGLIVTDTVFSMQGDLAKLDELVAVAAQYQAALMIDDAHGIGIFGPQGDGVSAHFNLTQTQAPILVCPLGKAFACSGAIVAGPQVMIDNIIQFAPSYIYTTAMPPALACAILASLQVIKQESWRRRQLFQLIDYFKMAAQQRGLTLLPSDSPIQSLLIPDPKQALAVNAYLIDKGYWASAMRPPTVPEGTSRLRITLSCLHEPSHIDDFLDHLMHAYETL